MSDKVICDMEGYPGDGVYIFKAQILTDDKWERKTQAIPMEQFIALIEGKAVIVTEIDALKVAVDKLGSTAENDLEEAAYQALNEILKAMIKKSRPRGAK